MKSTVGLVLVCLFTISSILRLNLALDAVTVAVLVLVSKTITVVVVVEVTDATVTVDVVVVIAVEVSPATVLYNQPLSSQLIQITYLRVVTVVPAH